MAGLGEEVVIRCPTCGYGLTARRYAVPKQCPLCRGSLDPADAPAPQPATATEKEAVVKDTLKDTVVAAGEREENEEPRESRITLSVRSDAETGPLGHTTQRMPDAEPEGATLEYELRAHEPAAAVEPSEAEKVEPQSSSRETSSLTQGAHTEHAAPVASARAEPPASAPPSMKMETVQTPQLSSTQPSLSQSLWSQPSPSQTAHQTAQPPQHPSQPLVQAVHARGPLEERVSPKVVVRYRDAYRVARVTVLIGNLIKVFGILVGLLVGGGLFALFATQGRLVGSTGAVGFFAGLIVGGSIFAFFFVLGVVISAQGQLIKATLDGAVGGSPFLTNEQRAEAMSLR